MHSPDDDPDTLVDAALAEAANLSTDPAFKAWCHDYRAGDSDESVARRALSAVWPEMPDITIEEVHGLMEDDVPRDVGEHGASRWATVLSRRWLAARVRMGAGTARPRDGSGVRPRWVSWPQVLDVAVFRAGWLDTARESGQIAKRWHG